MIRLKGDGVLCLLMAALDVLLPGSGGVREDGAPAPPAARGLAVGPAWRRRSRRTSLEIATKLVRLKHLSWGLVGGFVDGVCMGLEKRDSWQQDAGTASSGGGGVGGPGCGCGRLSLFAYRLICSSCGQVSTGEVVMPTSLEAGDVTTMFGSCPCGGDANGRARVLQVLTVP